MEENKKFEKFNRVSFILFSLYILIFIFLPIIEKDFKYLIFLIFPLIFVASLAINVLVKKESLEINKVEKASKKVSILNLLFNGISLGTLSSKTFIENMDFNTKKEQIKRYPSIEPTWLFVVILSTILSNFVFYMILFLAKSSKINKPFIIFSIISIIFLILGQVTSSFAMIYNNQKEELKKAWKVIGIVSFGLIIIFGFSYIVTM